MLNFLWNPPTPPYQKQSNDSHYFVADGWDGSSAPLLVPVKVGRHYFVASVQGCKLSSLLVPTDDRNGESARLTHTSFLLHEREFKSSAPLMVWLTTGKRRGEVEYQPSLSPTTLKIRLSSLWAPLIPVVVGSSVQYLIHLVMLG